MKFYQTPEINIMRIAEIGDVITFSVNERLGNIGTIGEDGGDFRIE